VKPHVLRYWEQEFPQLKPVKRRGNRRYGARQKLTGEEAKSDLSQSQQIIKQMRKELDEILKLLRR
jgi:DNA-binding transcriptional MerR regulator